MSEETQTLESEIDRLRRENKGLRKAHQELMTRIDQLHVELARPPEEVPITFRLWLRHVGRRWLRTLDGLIFGKNR